MNIVRSKLLYVMIWNGLSAVLTAVILVMIELNNSKTKIPPATVYGELSHLATNYKLDCFDVYGDYDKDNESSILRSFEGAVALLFGKDDVRAKREP